MNNENGEVIMNLENPQDTSFDLVIKQAMQDWRKVLPLLDHCISELSDVEEDIVRYTFFHNQPDEIIASFLPEHTDIDTIADIREKALDKIYQRARNKGLERLIQRENLEEILRFAGEIEFLEMDQPLPEDERQRAIAATRATMAKLNLKELGSRFKKLLIDLFKLPEDLVVSFGMGTADRLIKEEVAYAAATEHQAEDWELEFSSKDGKVRGYLWPVLQNKDKAWLGFKSKEPQMRGKTIFFAIVSADSQKIHKTGQLNFEEVEISEQLFQTKTQLQKVVADKNCQLCWVIAEKSQSQVSTNEAT